MKRTSHTQRTLALLKKEGWTVGIVERWIAFAKKRIDLFGIIDIVAIRPGVIFGVQSCGEAVADHVTKALAEPKLAEWLAAGGEFMIIGWTKKGPRGKVKKWTPRKLYAALVGGRILMQEFK